MHYGILVVLNQEHKEDDPTRADIEAAVEELLKPYGDGDKWDWYQIGGRWTGTLSGYDPLKDAANTEVCTLCAGTGRRPDAEKFGPEWLESTKGCNGCMGTGTADKWPTDWTAHEGDVLPLSFVTQEHLDKCFHAVVCDEGYGWLGGRYFRPWRMDTHDATDETDGAFQKLEKPPIEWLLKTFPNGIAVVVDCHN